MHQRFSLRKMLANTARHTGLLTLCLALLTVVTGVRGADSDSAAPQVKVVAPGVWRLRFGTPEKFTPTHFRTAPVDLAGLAAMPSAESMPLDRSQIRFHVSDRGCSLQLLKKPGHWFKNDRLNLQ